MTREYKLFLFDIVECIDNISEYTQDLTFEEFEKSRITVDAVLRNIEIIGEATLGVPDYIKDKYDIPWRLMKDMRNQVIHVYFGVDLEIVWNVVSNHLPTLREQIVEVIENETK